MGSPEFEAARSSKSAVAIWTVHIHIPAFGALSALNVYWSTGDTIELEDGNVYLKETLRSIPRGRHQRDRGNDYAEFSVANPDNILFETFSPYEDLMETAEVTIRECYEIEIGLFESEIRFFGYLKDYANNTQELELSFTVMSDMSRLNHFVGNRILTRERCGTNFNVNGLIPPNTPGVPCTWQTEQGGNPLKCTKFLKGVDGCEAHNNTHQFYAVEGYKTAEVDIITTGGSETGFPYETGPCFTSRMFMVMDLDFNVMPFDMVEAGMTHLGFDIYNEDRLIESKILWGQSHHTDHYWVAMFDVAEIETAHHHPFYVGDRFFVPVGGLGKRPALGLYSSQKRGISVLNSMEKVVTDDRFYEFHTVIGNYIVCDAKKQFFYFVHNAKPQLPNQY